MIRRSRGFTLLEVLAAIVIMALAFTVFLQAAGTSVSLTHKSAMRTRAAAWGQSFLDSRYALAPPRPGTTSGRFDDTYRWQLTVTPWIPPDAGGATNGGDVQLYKLDLAVRWGARARSHVAHFATVRAVRRHAAVASP